MGGTVFVASTFPKRMTLANGSLYWVATMPMGYALKTAPVGNGPNPTVTTLYADTTRNCVEKGISADATGVYWTSLCEPMMLTNQYAVRKCALPAGCGTGPTAATTLASNLTRAQGNTVANGFVYWTEQSSAAPVKRIGTNGNGGSTLFQNPTDPKFVNPVSIVTDGTDVAWTTSGNPIAVGYVAVCPVSGCPAEASMVKFGTPVSGLIALAPGKVVYTEGGKIRTANRDGTGAADLVTADASALTADATHVYWQERALGGADQVGKRIFKCALAGCAGTGTVLASDAIPLLGPTGDLLVDATHVFYMANPYEPAISGAIMRVAK